MHFSLHIVLKELDYLKYLKIYQHIARHFVHYVECLSNLPPFLCSHIINSFLNSRISANHDKVKGLPANVHVMVKSLLRGLLLYSYLYIL